MASRRIAGITLEIDGNTSKLNDALKSVDKQLASTQSQLKDVEKLLKMDPRNTELLAQKQKLLTDAISGTKDRLKELEKAQEQLNKQEATPELEKQQQALQREIIATKKQLEGFTDELDKIPNKAQLAFESIGESLQKTGEKITNVGESMTKYVTGPIAATGTAAVAAFSEVDDAMDTVIKKTGATGDAAKELQSTVEDLATTLPVSFDEAANAVGQINTRFGATGSQLDSLSRKFLKFASINNKDVSGSIDSVQKATAAYGLELKDVDHLMDVLSKVSQDTGADVDALANGVVQNAAAFQEMGLTIDEAVALMGQMEKSGADSGAVMSGLGRALKQSAKDGVPLSKTLKDLQTKIRDNSDETEALNYAYEIFGKSGAQVFNAIRSGTLDFENFGNTLEDVGGIVDSTFDATVDGVDNWKMAMNEAKLLGADIGGILSEFAGPILTKVRDALKEAVGWWRGLTEEEKNTVINTAAVVAAIGPAVTIVGKLTETVGLLSKGLGLIAAHPVVAAIGLGVTAFTALAVAVKEAGDAGDAYMEEMYGVNEEMQANIDKINELKDAYEQSVENKKEAFEQYDTEYDYLKKLAEEYDTYLDSNGKVIEKYKDRAGFIENELSKALGIERDDVKKIVEENGNLSDSIANVIEMRKAEAVLNKLEEDYAKAKKYVVVAEQALLKAEEDLYSATKKRTDIEEEMDKWSKIQIENADAQNEAYEEACNKLADLRVDLEYATNAEEEAAKAVANAEETYKGYQATIKQYEGVSAAVISGDTNKIRQSMEQYRQDFRTTETATTETLKRQVENYRKQYEEAKKAVERGSKTVTKADLDEKAYWYKQAQTEYNKATKQAKNAASDAAGGYAAELRAGRPKVERATDYVAGGVTDPLKGLKGKAEDYGYDVDQGLANGINNNKWRVNAAVNNVSNAIDQLFRRDLLINSPSKLTEYFGRMLDEGLAIGMQNGDAIEAAKELSQETAAQFQAQETRGIVASTTPANPAGMVEAFQVALSRMKVEMDDREMGRFVESTVVKAVYA